MCGPVGWTNVTSQKSNKNKSRANPCFVVELDPLSCFIFRLTSRYPEEPSRHPNLPLSHPCLALGLRVARGRHTRGRPRPRSAPTRSPPLSLYFSPLLFFFFFSHFLSLFFSFPPFLSFLLPSPSLFSLPFLSSLPLAPGPRLLLLPPLAPPGRALHRGTPPLDPALGRRCAQPDPAPVPAAPRHQLRSPCARAPPLTARSAPHARLSRERARARPAGRLLPPLCPRARARHAATRRHATADRH